MTGNRKREFLTDMHLFGPELTDLTGYSQFEKRKKALLEMGIPFKVNPKGRILVLRDDYPGRKPAKRTQPNWSALEKAS